MTSPEADLSPVQYQDLAEFRRQIRSFLHFSETIAKDHGLEPRQHQLLLAVHGLPPGVKPTIGEIAARLFIRHHSAVELAGRLEGHGVITRRASENDKREVLLQLTSTGRAILRKLAIAHRDELERSGPALARALHSTLRHSRESAPAATAASAGK